MRQFLPFPLLRAVLLGAAVCGAVLVGSGCDSAPEQRSAEYDGTVGDAMIDFIDTVEEIAEILADVDSIEDCESVKASLAARVERLERIHALVGGFTAQTWQRMPSSLAESRASAMRRFNAEAARVMLDNRRARVLRDVLRNVPDLLLLAPDREAEST